jgi:carbon monoxide dehydrogenase subunit G
MQLEHSFTVPVGVEDAWAVLLDIEQIAPCMPGAAIDSVDGDDFTGSVKVKLGPIGLTYKGKASFIEKDAATHRAVIDARGRDSRGNGTASAKITATLTEEGAATTVHVVTDLDITGKPAQFGRGVMVDVGNKLIGQFADCLAGKLADGGDATTAQSPVAESKTTADSPTTSAPAGPSRPTPGARPAPPVEPINLIESAGPAIVKRLAPVAAVLAVLLFFLLRRRTKCQPPASG